MNTLLQHGYGPATELLDITQKHHHAWCAQNGWMMHEDRDQQFSPRLIHFEKWRVIHDGLFRAPDESLVVYVDADTIVLGELDDALDLTDDIGVTRWQGPYNSSAALYFRASDKTRSFAEHIANLATDPKFQHVAETATHFIRHYPDEPVFDKTLRNSDLKVRQLDRRWNAISYMMDLRVLGCSAATSAESAEKMKAVMKDREVACQH